MTKNLYEFSREKLTIDEVQEQKMDLETLQTKIDSFTYVIIWERECAVKEIKKYVLENAKKEMEKHFPVGGLVLKMMRALDPLKVYDRVIDEVLNPIVKNYAGNSIDQIKLIAEDIINESFCDDKELKEEMREEAWKKYLNLEILLEICKADKNVEKAVKRKYDDERTMIKSLWSHFKNSNEDEITGEMYEEFIREAYNSDKNLFCQTVISGSSKLEKLMKNRKFELKEDLISNFVEESVNKLKSNPILGPGIRSMEGLYKSIGALFGVRRQKSLLATLDKERAVKNLIKEIVSWYVLTIIEGFKKYTKERADEIFTE